MKMTGPHIKLKLAVMLLCISGLLASATGAEAESGKNQQGDSTVRNDFSTFQDHSFSWAALVLPHRSLRNSKNLRDWPAFGFAAPMAWNSSIGLTKDYGKILATKAFASGNLSVMDIGATADASLELLHLVELGISANIHSSINYGDFATFMGVYDTEEKEYKGDWFMTEFAYGIKYRAGITLPLMVFLPKSDWTKIILKPVASWTYTAYTGAEDGDIWKCGADNSANGYRYRYGGTLIYMLPFQWVPMFMVNAGVGGFFKSTEFKEEFSDYNPYFKTVNITPMLSLKIWEKWSAMAMAVFSRDRKYEKYHYDAEEELLQKQVGAEWGLRVVMMTFTRKF